MPRGTGAQEEYNSKPRKIAEARGQKEAREQHIAKALTKYNEKEHLRGETLPEEQQVYRVKAFILHLLRHFHVEMFLWRTAGQFTTRLR